MEKSGKLENCSAGLENADVYMYYTVDYPCIC